MSGDTENFHCQDFTFFADPLVPFSSILHCQKPYFQSYGLFADNAAMSPQDFIAKWGAPDGVPGPSFALNEEQGAQSHFLDLCELLGVPKPGSAEGYLFEEKGVVIGRRIGYADVFMRGVFAWENKAPGGNLDAAFRQLLAYSFAMSSPPILVVSDRFTIRIHSWS